MENNTWFECALECVYSDEVSAKEIKERGNYLVDSMSFTEAEARMTEKIKEMPKGIYTIKKLQILKLDALYDDDENYEKWWKVKVVIKEETEGGKTKNYPYLSIIHANDAEEAAKLIAEKYKDSVSNWEIKEVKEYQLKTYFKRI